MFSPPRRVSQADPESPSLGRRPRITMGSWARRTGFRATSSGSDIEINLSDGTPIPKLSVGDAGAPGKLVARSEVDSDDSGSGRLRIEPLRLVNHQDGDHHVDEEAQVVSLSTQSHMKYELRENPGHVPVALYAAQHYLSIAGSLILVPLIIVPAMGGTPEDTAKVVSSMLMVTGLSTLLHTSFGSRLPLIQGASFVYLAPALAIIFSPHFANLTENRFKRTMRELQGAVIIGGLFQGFLGYSGIMSFFLRVINPVVVAPTITAVGLAFYAYGFTVVGRCVEIGIPQLLLLVLFALYLRKIAVFGHRIFQVYAVPLGLSLAWAYAFLLTQSKVYTYAGCSVSQLRGNYTASQVDSAPGCSPERTATVLSCRTDASDALAASAWFRVPYPFQWGVPSVHWETAAVMVVASVVASVDSVGAYHASSLLVASRAPTPGVVSRSIGLEGLTTILAGFFGTGSGATTLTENVHTIAVTKMGSRRPVEFGACILILMSLIGKISGFIATIPQVIVAALLVFMWTMLAAMGMSTLRYSETGSSRNVIIVGLSLFLSLSVPSYFQQYDYTSSSSVTVPTYFQPYNVAAHGPIHTSSKSANFALNTIFSLHMVIALLVACTLDNTVPGTRQERGLYVWSDGRTARNEPSVVKDYELPFGWSRFFTWVKWVGL